MNESMNESSADSAGLLVSRLDGSVAVRTWTWRGMVYLYLTTRQSPSSAVS